MAKKLRTIITPGQFDALYAELPSDAARLLAELDIETGLRWSELIELRTHDFDRTRQLITVRRIAVELVARFHPTGGRFLIKDYPKDREHRQVKLAAPIAAALAEHIQHNRLGPDDLLFTPHLLRPPARHLGAEPADADHGLTDPNPGGHRHRHGTLSGYTAGHCRCEHCRHAYAAYRAGRRAAGKDQPRGPRRTIDTVGHLPRSWFRNTIWKPALTAAGVGIRVRPHDLRHAHASWLLAGGADIQTVKERLGHASINTTEKYLHALTDSHDIALDALAAIRQRHRQVG